MKTMMVPIIIPILIPGTCEYGTLHSKREFADVIELRILGWGDKREITRKQEGQTSRRRCDHRSKGRSGVRKGPAAKECRQPLEVEKGRKQTLP